MVGGSRGIGAAVVRKLSAQGARVVAGFHTRAADAEALAASCAGLPGEVVAQQCDVRSRRSVDALVAATLERWGRIDVLVNSAGLLLTRRSARSTWRSGIRFSPRTWTVCFTYARRRCAP